MTQSTEKRAALMLARFNPDFCTLFDLHFFLIKAKQLL
jgi:hypothetical protein